MAATVTVLVNGPLQVKGDYQVLDAQGNALPSKEETAYLCRCGGSTNKPFCDGSHKKIDFKG
jgi:CDGSH-type Zn-finger protein